MVAMPRDALIQTLVTARDHRYPASSMRRARENGAGGVMKMMVERCLARRGRLDAPLLDQNEKGLPLGSVLTDKSLMPKMNSYALY